MGGIIMWLVAGFAVALCVTAGIYLYRILEQNRQLKAVQEETTHQIDFCRQQEETHLLLQAEAEWYKRLAENAVDCIWLLDLQSYTYTYVSPSVYELRGLKPEDALGEKLEDSLTSESVTEFYHLMNRTMDKLMTEESETVSNGFVCELDQYHKDGHTIRIEVSIRMIFEQDGNLQVLGVSRDVSEKRKLLDKLNREQEELQVQTTVYEALFKNTSDAIACFDQEERITDLNNQFCKMFGYSMDEAKGQYLNDIVFNQPRDTHYDITPIALEIIQSSSKVEQETIRFHRDGTAIHVLAKGVPIYIHGKFWGGYGVYTDITARKKAEKKLKQLATTDSLTGLFNRRQFMESAAYELRKSSRYGYPFSLLILDIDFFKNINDTYGHDIGDLVLVLLANKLKQEARDADEVFRIGGEEFCMILPNTSAESALVVGERLRKAIENDPLSHGDHSIHFTASIGIADNQQEPTVTVDELFKRADSALYDAKRQGRNRVVLSS